MTSYDMSYNNVCKSGSWLLRLFYYVITEEVRTGKWHERVVLCLKAPFEDSNVLVDGERLFGCL